MRNNLPNAGIERLIKNSGASRVSGEAVIELQSILEEQGRKIATRAITLAAHASRKTIKASDIKLAVKGGI